MKWGLVPHYSKTEDTTLSTINARAENLVEGGSTGIWGSIKGSKRCVVPVQGYYEWLKKGKERLPHFTRHAGGGQLMLLAGLYDVAYLEGQTSPLFTFAIVTTAASQSMSWLHDRQPVILSSDTDALAWLDNSKPWSSTLASLLDLHDETARPLECYVVPKEVGKVGTESATFIEPVSRRKDGIEAMFSKQSHAKALPLKTGEKRKRLPSPGSSPPKRGHEEEMTGTGKADSDVELVETPKSSQTKSRSPKKPKVCYFVFRPLAVLVDIISDGNKLLTEEISANKVK
ncbi:hypothetical protein OF83DRAFT_1137987 [Amylostereum chailletii]|nr:hypothetical protein OF83DRAFT_1137987 [Amylostereum chailletii]